MTNFTLDDKTAQYIFKLLAWTCCMCLAGCFLTMFISIFYFGDGEGLRILNSLSTPVTAILGAVASFAIAHIVAGTVISSKQIAASGTSIPAMPLPVPVAVPVVPSASEPANSPSGAGAIDLSGVTGAGV